MQRFDVFFKRAFSQYKNAFLAVMKKVIPENFGNRVVQELPVEIVKGALRVDKIFRTDDNTILLIDFEETFTLDALFEILTHTVAHAHSTKMYKILLSEKKEKLPYLPLLVAAKVSKKHMQYLLDIKAGEQLMDGVYRLQGTLFFGIYLIVLTELNLAECMLEIAGLCENKTECKTLAAELRRPEFWSTKRARKNPKMKDTMNVLLEKFGELIFLLNPNLEYVFNVWRFAAQMRKGVSKGILDSMLILFLKEVKQMSAAQILTKREKKELIEALGIEDAIEAIGIEKVIEVVGVDKVIDAIGLERVLEAAGREKLIEALVKSLKLSEKDRESLMKIFKKTRK